MFLYLYADSSKYVSGKLTNTFLLCVISNNGMFKFSIFCQYSFMKGLLGTMPSTISDFESLITFDNGQYE